MKRALHVKYYEKIKIPPDVRLEMKIQRLKRDVELFKVRQIRADARASAGLKRAIRRIFAKFGSCAQCGCEITRRRGLRYCPICQHTVKRAAHKADKARRRGAWAETVIRHKVFDRDGWRCQICRRPTPKRLDGTYKLNAPEMDHRIPVTKGGSHSYANCQCTCRECNLMKSNKMIIGQLPLWERG